MAKFFFAVVLAVTVAISFAQSECPQSFKEMLCQREVQQMPLDACRQLLDRQLSGLRVVVPSWMRPWQPRAQCCQQLQDVSPECRCTAIRQIVRIFEQSLAPLEGGCGGKTAEQQQRGGYYGGQEQGGYCGERRQQGGYYGETGQQQAGGCCHCNQREEWQQSGDHQASGQPKQNRGYIGFPPHARTGQQTTHERLTKVQQYAQQLLAMCQMEPRECSIFAGGQYQA